MFDVLTPGNVNTPQYIKMPAKSVEITANYKTKYRVTIKNGTINEASASQEYYEAGTKLNITADEPEEGLRFQYWSGDVDNLGSIYDPTTTLTVTEKAVTITAVYSSDADRNNVGYVTTDLSSTETINNSDITIVSGEIGVGFIITDVNGQVYIITNVENDISTIYRMTKIVQGGDIYV
jgi:hypothetical protein